MADYEPGHQNGAWDESGGYEVTDGNKTEHIQQHSTDQDQAEYSVDPTQHASGDSPSPDGATDDAGDYDPASVTVTSAPAPDPESQSAENQASPRPSPQRAAKKKPRTAGGFLVGDSDSEDDEAPAPASSGPPGAPGAASQPSVPRSPAQQQHPITVRQATVTASDAPPAHQANAAAAGPADAQRNGNVTAPPSVPAAAAGPAPQAPVDKIAQLEARVRDDPRGAMDAWLALIAEHRARTDIEQARQVYERFFAVFPQAVSLDIDSGDQVDLDADLRRRPTSGLTTSRWSWN